MRRAERLFQIIQILRGERRPVTAARLAEEMETSVRTIYRDIAELMAQRVPIQGEAGIGYVLGSGYDMPPLMLTPNEIEVLVLGAQWVSGRGDQALQRGARDLIAKINQVVPKHLRPMVVESSGMAPNMGHRESDALDMEQLRLWIRTQRKLAIHYVDGNDQPTDRVIWPLAVAYFESVRLMIAWCELRQGFRHFRTDRIRDSEFLSEAYPGMRRTLLARWAKSESDKQASNGCL